MIRGVKCQNCNEYDLECPACTAVVVHEKPNVDNNPTKFVQIISHDSDGICVLSALDASGAVWFFDGRETGWEKCCMKKEQGV